MDKSTIVVDANAVLISCAFTLSFKMKDQLTEAIYILNCVQLRNAEITHFYRVLCSSFLNCQVDMMSYISKIHQHAVDPGV